MCKALVIFCLLPLSVLGQSQTNNLKTANDIVGRDKKTIKNNVINQYGANSIAINELTINENFKTKLVLVEAKTEIDPLRRYVTHYKFKTKDNIPAYNVDLTFTFNSPVDTATSYFEGTVMNFTSYFKMDYLASRVTIEELPPGSALLVDIVSKKEIQITLSDNSPK